jgi:hypothetical protein
MKTNQTKLLDQVNELKHLVINQKHSLAVIHCLDLAIELKKAKR